jgi:hypothetical protein
MGGSFFKGFHLFLFKGVSMTVLEGSAVAAMCFFTVFLALGGVFVLMKVLSALLGAISRERKEE